MFDDKYDGKTNFYIFTDKEKEILSKIKDLDYLNCDQYTKWYCEKLKIFLNGIGSNSIQDFYVEVGGKINEKDN